MEVFWWLLGIIASATITILINDPIHYFIAQRLGSWINQSRSLKGVWRGEYDFVSQSDKRLSEDFYVIRQFGNYVVIRSINADYQLRGKLSEQSILTGTWVEKTSDDRIYYGSFQLVVKATRTEMEGKWIGFNRQFKIMSGNWQWKLTTTDASKSSVINFTKPS